MTVMRYVIAVSLASAVYACSCMGPNPICAVYWNAPMIFTGHVVSKQLVLDDPSGDARNPGRYEVFFAVTESFKGEPGKGIVIRTHNQSSACGFDFEVGKDYVVFAESSKGEWWAGTCSHTHLLPSSDDADLKWMHGVAAMASGATIYGNVALFSPAKDPRVAPLAHLSVSVSGPQSRTVTTDAQGNFSVGGLAPGKYAVSAAVPEGDAAIEPQSVSVVDRGCAEIPLVTRMDGRIRGHVYLPSGAPAVGANLTLESADADPRQAYASGSHRTSLDDGSFDFGPLEPGRYIFGANVDSPPFQSSYYRKVFYPSGMDRGGAKRITLAAAQRVEDLRFELPEDRPAPSIPLDVTLVDPSGKPVPNATIMADDDMWDSSIARAAGHADSSGKTTVLLRPGSYYYVWAGASVGQGRQICAEPVGMLAEGELKPITLQASHAFGNC